MLHVAASQMGQTERAPFLAAAGIANVGMPSWDAPFLAWAALSSGIPPPLEPHQPASWLAWGTLLSQPQAGAVVVLTGAGRPGFQCGVVARVGAGKVYVVGAFDDAVQTRAFPVEQVIAARRPPAGSTAEAAPVSLPQSAPAIVAAPVAVPAISAPSPSPSVATPPAPDAVTAQHLEALLGAVQEKFAALDAEISGVRSMASRAVGDIKILEVTD